MVDRRCAMISDVRPSTMRPSASRTLNSVSVSTLEVASSRIRIFGSCARARANEMSCFCPVEAFGQRADKVPEVHVFSGLLDVLVLNALGAQPNVAAYRAAEQEWVLQHDPEAAAQIREIHFFHVDAVDAHRAFLHIIKAQQQGDERSLAGAGMADHR